MVNNLRYGMLARGRLAAAGINLQILHIECRCCISWRGKVDVGLEGAFPGEVICHSVGENYSALVTITMCVPTRIL